MVSLTAIVLSFLVACGVVPGATSHEFRYARASTLQATSGNVQVRITSATVLHPAIYSGQWQTLKTSSDPCLQLSLEIRAPKGSPELHYRSWGRIQDGLEPPALTDNQGNPLKLIDPSPSMPAGRSRQATDRGKQHPGITDVLLFEVPPASAEELELQLPAANFGAQGTLEFKIPSTLLRR